MGPRRHGRGSYFRIVITGSQTEERAPWCSPGWYLTDVRRSLPVAVNTGRSCKQKVQLLEVTGHATTRQVMVGVLLKPPRIGEVRKTYCSRPV